MNTQGVRTLPLQGSGPELTDGIQAAKEPTPAGEGAQIKAASGSVPQDYSQTTSIQLKEAAVLERIRKAEGSGDDHLQRDVWKNYSKLKRDEPHLAKVRDVLGRMHTPEPLDQFKLGEQFIRSGSKDDYLAFVDQLEDTNISALQKRKLTELRDAAFELPSNLGAARDAVTEAAAEVWKMTDENLLTQQKYVEPFPLTPPRRVLAQASPAKKPSAPTPATPARPSGGWSLFSRAARVAPEPSRAAQAQWQRDARPGLGARLWSKIISFFGRR